MSKEMAVRAGVLLLAAAAAGAGAEPRLSGLGSAAVGYEDNVVLAPDQLAGDSETGDNFFELLGVGWLSASGPQGTDLTLTGSAYALDYWDLSRFDIAALRAGPELAGGAGDWRWRLEASGAMVYLDRDRFERLVTVDARVRRFGARDLSWELGFRRDWITGYSPYRYLSGTRDRIRVAGRYRPADLRMRAGYELELNDRDDLRVAGDFASYSPTRHTLFAELGVRPGPWALDLESELRFSAYNDPHRLAGRTRTRKDTRWRTSVRVSRQLDGILAVFGEVVRTVNESNFAGDPFTDYGYISNYYLVGLEHSF